MEKNNRNAQAYARPFELIMRSIFGCDKWEVCGMADADFIRANPYTAVVATCMYIYAKADDGKKKEIESFLDDARFHFQFNFDTLLSFDTNEKEIDGVCYTLSYADGETAIKTLEEKFRSICKNK